jgi:phosphoserine phosphatase
MKHLGIDDYAANRLEFVKGYATGRILPPIMASATKAKWMREYAERENINLSESYAIPTAFPICRCSQLLVIRWQSIPIFA